MIDDVMAWSCTAHLALGILSIYLWYYWSGTALTHSPLFMLILHTLLPFLVDEWFEKDDIKKLISNRSNC
jgi:hypothetical protein